MLVPGFRTAGAFWPMPVRWGVTPLMGPPMAAAFGFFPFPVSLPQKIRDEATGESFSPDGTLLSFETNAGKNGDREIWVMRPDGQQSRKVFEVGENDSIGGLTWSPDGRRVIYVRQDGPDSANTYFESGDLKGGPVTKILSPFDTKLVSNSIWLPDGRLIYRLDEPGFKVKTCNLWQINMNPQLTAFVGKATAHYQRCRTLRESGGRDVGQQTARGPRMETS